MAEGKIVAEDVEKLFMIYRYYSCAKAEFTSYIKRIISNCDDKAEQRMLTEVLGNFVQFDANIKGWLDNYANQKGYNDNESTSENNIVYTDNPNSV
jgi:hypothetical protein